MAQKYHLQINYWRLLRSTLLLSLLTVVLFFVVFHYSENGDGTETVFHLAKFLFITLAFLLIILQKFSVFDGWTTLIIGILVSALFYGLLIEFVFALYQNNKEKAYRKL
jgi:positive regulator of sigma E activity